MRSPGRAAARARRRVAVAVDRVERPGLAATRRPRAGGGRRSSTGAPRWRPAGGRERGLVDPAHVRTHRGRCSRSVPGAERLERGPVDGGGRRDREPARRAACSVAVRRPPSSTARSPRIAPGPTSATARRRRRRRARRRAARNSSSPGSPCSTSVLALLHRADLGLVAAAHDRGRQLALERGLDRGDERLRVLVAPRRVLAERVAVPVLEVGERRPWPRAAPSSS